MIHPYSSTQEILGEEGQAKIGFLPSDVSGDISRRKVFCLLSIAKSSNIQNFMCAGLKAFKIMALFLLNFFFLPFI